MPDLAFQIEGAQAIPYAAAPTLALKLRITDTASQPIHTLSLNCQVQIEPTRRRYAGEEQKKLRDLFGEPERWSRTVRSLLWMNVNLSVPAFTDTVLVDLQLPCSFDFNVAATKYFHALEGGEVPLCVLFSGTVFYRGEEGALQVAQVPWNREANYRLSAATWKEMMDLYYPNSAWLCLERDVFDRLYQFKVSQGIPTWEQVLDRLMASEQKNEVTV
ncbi:hypothetical protein ACPOL_0988 [Acidisarcina polymorpha]|uniref:Uncharacterized protein n=1 Tax=Acidisarcina polymorpha TaxID=2211140 RepID=A0A2Z5FU08_9BACT|nr:DUF6084 family protein [Acidisarcina polymorpha]AXC10339.1 hypothetical protein ACPOL_0988 [Acidisarcina polymorpha]